MLPPPANTSATTFARRSLTATSLSSSNPRPRAPAAPGEHVRGHVRAMQPHREVAAVADAAVHEGEVVHGIERGGVGVAREGAPGGLDRQGADPLHARFGGGPAAVRAARGPGARAKWCAERRGVA